MEATRATDDLLSRLAAIPLRIADAVKDRSEAQLRTTFTPDEWSVTDIFAHIRASDDILAYRAYAILARDNPPLTPYDERRWGRMVGYAQADFRTSLELFTLRRAELVRMLRQIAPADWERSGVHDTRGRLLLSDVIAGLVEHEEEHCAQIEDLLNR
jgi:hypothetical protein